MPEKSKAAIIFQVLLKRHNIDNAYAMVGPEDREFVEKYMGS